MANENLASYNPLLVLNVGRRYAILQGLNKEHGLLRYCELKAVSGHLFGQMVFSLKDDPVINWEFQNWFGAVRDPSLDNGASFSQALERYIDGLDKAIFQEIFRTPGDIEAFLEVVEVEKLQKN